MKTLNKYRVWIEADKRHYEVRAQFWIRNLVTEYLNQVSYDDESGHYCNKIIGDGVILEAWTGETDKNGTKIFFGDNLMYIGTAAPIFIIETQTVKIVDNVIRPFNLAPGKDWEIIGHIHEEEPTDE